ncbi:MAG: EMC3/TMCO1 family protein [Candidatus Bathyarchaeia archaeon]
MRETSLWMLESPPYITLFTILIALLTSLILTLINRKFIDKRLLAEFQKEYSEWRIKLEQAKKTGDKKLIAKLKKDEIRLNQMKAKVYSQQLKTTFITSILIFAIWWFLLPYLHKPAAFIPLLGDKINVPFFIWYVICSFFFHFLLSKNI